MSADHPERQKAAALRVPAGFRPGDDLSVEELEAAGPQALVFTPAAEAGNTDFDVLMGYQMFLGRDPESSFVIADAKSSPVGAFIRALMASGEFQSAVLDRLAAGRPLPHEAASLAPSPEQMGWLLRHIRVPAPAEAALRRAADWRGWLGTLVAVPGFPLSPERAGRPVEAGMAAQAADDGFVLVHLEQPKGGERIEAGAQVMGAGWAIAPADVAEVAVHLDDTLLTHARYGLPRPDVARNFPHYRHVDHCGFSFTAEIPAGLALHARSQLVVTVRTVRGETGRKAVRVQPPQAVAAQQVGGRQDGGRQDGGRQDGGRQDGGGHEAWPIRLAVEDASVDEGFTLRLLGWAASLAKLRAVSVFLGDVALGEAQLGLARPDIARMHPDYPHSAQSGFVLVAALPEQVQGGPGFVRVEAQDTLGRSRQAIIPLSVPARHAAAAQDEAGVRGSCDEAALSADGHLTVSGWALAADGPAGIEITLDGAVVGSAQAGLARPDVGRRYPEEALAASSGFRFETMLEPPPGPGEHALCLRIGDDRIARRIDLVVRTREATGEPAGPAAKPTPAEMRLEVDHPVLEAGQALASVRGALTISGWAIARRGLSGVAVYCDEHLLGQAYLGMRREDIGAAFPDYEGSLLAGYALVLPPGTLPAGMHEIRVVASASPDAGGVAAERRFALTVEEWDALPPGGTIRTHVPPAECAFGLRLLERHAYRPLFEIAVLQRAEGAAGLDGLVATLASLAGQVYPDWRARVVLSGKAGAADRRLLDLQAASEGRIVLAQAASRKPRGRSAAGARRPVLAMRLVAGDRLGADALLALAGQAAADREVDFFYADDLRNDAAQGRRQPFFKPAFSPELLLATNYIGRAWCASDALTARAGIADGMADYEAVLRLTEQAARIGQLPGVLLESADGGDAPAAEQAALTACLARRGLAGDVQAGPALGTWRVRRALALKSAAGKKRGAKAARPLVSIIIPTCSARELIRTAIKTIRAASAPACAGGVAVEIVVLDNTPAREKRARAWLRRNADRVIDMPGAFNWSRFNNEGARAAEGEYLLFLNDDIEAPAQGWLEAMLEFAQLPQVGVVGARLLYPDGKVQHGGQYLSDNHARHAFRFADAATPGPFGLAQLSREMISVTGACQMVRAEVFARLGGFEEAHSVVNNDLDFCLRSWAAGLSVIFTPHATLIHHELASRAALQDSYDEARFLGAWRTRFLAGDPFRSPRLGEGLDHYGSDPEPAVRLYAGRRGPPVAEIRRILAVKLDHIGDFLTALPALRSLKRVFPHARIDLLAPAATAELARGQGVVDEVIVFDFFHARSGEGRRAVGEAEFRALQSRLSPSAYDLAIDLRMQPETRAVLPWTGAALLAGYDHGDQFGFLDVALVWEGDTRLVAKRAHVSERLLQLVSAVVDACSEREPAPERPSLPAQPALPAQWTPALGVPALAALPAAFLARRLVCVHPGVGNVVRQWPAGHYAALIDLLAEAGLHTVLIGGPDETGIAEEVLRRVRATGAAESLVGRVKLAQLPDVMRACALFVGNNSGPQHIAASLGMPAIGIHSGVVDAAEWAPLGPQAMAMRRRMICSPCYLEFASDCPRSLACLTGLRPAEVFAACRHLLAAPI